MLKQWFISEYWRAQGIYESLRTKQSGRGYLPQLHINTIMLNGHHVMPLPSYPLHYPGAKICIFTLLIVMALLCTN